MDKYNLDYIQRDLTSGIVVFLVALPLCLGIAHASGAPLLSGIVAGIVGGIVVGIISGSHTSVTGPAAGLVAVVLSQISELNSFNAFLLAVFLAGVMQLFFGVLRIGKYVTYCPNIIIKALLAAIGLIIIFKQIPVLFGYVDLDKTHTFMESEIGFHFFDFVSHSFSLHHGASIIGVISLTALFILEKKKFSLIPPGLLVVVFGSLVSWIFHFNNFDSLALVSKHLVQVPISKSLGEFVGFLEHPDFSYIFNYKIYVFAFTIALVASLESLLNLEAIDRIDPEKRFSPPDRELVAQGVGNMVSGLLGGIPVTSVIVRSSVNLQSGNKTKLSAIFHGFLLFFLVLYFPTILNLIPMSSLAAILIFTGLKLASPKELIKVLKEPKEQSLPFFVTIASIIATDLLTGLIIGLIVSVCIILAQNFKRPFRIIDELHVGGHVVRILLPNQVSFLVKAPLVETLHSFKEGDQVVIDASQSDYIDHDIIEVIEEYANTQASHHGVKVSLSGFKKKYNLENKIQFVDVSTRESQSTFSPDMALDLLREGNKRFVQGERLYRDPARQINMTSEGQYPIAAVVSCIDSRTSTELIFDQGLGDIFSIRMAGTALAQNVLGSVEFACKIAGVKLVVVLGHTKCGAIKTACELHYSAKDPVTVTGCANIESITDQIFPVIDKMGVSLSTDLSQEDSDKIIDSVAEQNVHDIIAMMLNNSSTLKELVDSNQIAIVGGMYDVKTGLVSFI